MMVAGGQRNASGQYALPDTQNQAWAQDKSRFGSRMLEKYGWSSGKGLGKKEDGIAEHVRVVKRSEALGLGARPAGAGSEAALSSAVADYNAILASLAAAGGAPAPPAGGRPKRARSASEASAASSEAPPPPPAAAQPGVRLIGRFAHHRALRQKNVAGYSAADLQAILGTHGLGAGGRAGGAGEAVALPSAPLVHRASVSLGVRKRDKKDKREKAEKQEKRARKEERRQRKAVAAAAAVAAAEAPPAAAAAAAAAAGEGEGETAEERQARREARRERKRLKAAAAGGDD
jgi:Pin2-interacting protein X1